MDKEQKIIIEISNKYKAKLANVKKAFILCSQKFDLCFFQQTMEQYRVVLKEIVIEISKKYIELKNADFIMVNGSFARHSNIFSSDLDLNIMYKDNFRDVLLPIELSINYILSKVLNFKGCDRIHSIMVYTPLISADEPVLFNNMKLSCKFGDVPYFCRENYERLLFETCNSTRDYNTLLSYIGNSNSLALEEWESNFELIVDYGKYSDFEAKILNLKGTKTSNTNTEILNNNIEEVLNRINDFKFLDNVKKINIRDLKAKIKTIPLEILYKALTLINFNEITFTKLDNLSNNKKISKDLIMSMYIYLWILTRVQIVFDKIGYDLSSRSSKQIDINDLRTIYYKSYNADIIDDINTSLKDMFKQVNQTLIKQKENLNE